MQYHLTVRVGEGAKRQEASMPVGKIVAAGVIQVFQ